jgi:hypothetical protein
MDAVRERAGDGFSLSMSSSSAAAEEEEAVRAEAPKMLLELLPLLPKAGGAPPDPILDDKLDCLTKVGALLDEPSAEPGAGLFSSDISGDSSPAPADAKLNGWDGRAAVVDAGCC